MTRYEVWLVDLDPTRGSEIQKTRPCVIVSPNAINKVLRTVVIVPLTHNRKSNYLFRANSTFKGVEGSAAVDQVRVVSKERLLKKIGTFKEDEGKELLAVLRVFFSESLSS